MPQLSVVGSETDSASERLAARIVAEENRGLLRFLTCGSVDDGKSTLIGRLLYDSALVFEDQLQSVQRESKRPSAATVRGARPFASGRRPSGRARAGHHHRRGLSLFLDAAAEVHRRRHAGPCAVHAQHGDRRVQLRFRRAAGRRAAGRPDPDAASRLHLVVARHQEGRGRRQQDGSGRLRSGALRGDRRGLCRFRRAPRLRAHHRHSRVGAQG